MYECRNDIDIFADLARRGGIEAYNDKTEVEWLRELTRDAVDDFDTFMRKGLARLLAPSKRFPITHPRAPEAWQEVRSVRQQHAIVSALMLAFRGS